MVSGPRVASCPGMQTPEALAPQVVAVIVACDPGDWFEEALGAFAAQDYPELSVLVLDCGVADTSDRVAAVLPSAYVRRLPDNLGFGASANAVLEMVEGASHFLFCHDDVAPDPDTVSILVEESFRSNAGVVGPKIVSWDDPRRLLHVGMAVDKGGAVVDRVAPGELDQGQHDSVRDVFLAPGGCMLVRADLFDEIGGFDPQIFAMGEDLDLCWRAQVAGARVMVAPEARARHLQMLAAGRRGLPDAVRHAVPRSSETRSSEGLSFEGRVWRASESPEARDDEPGVAPGGGAVGAGGSAAGDSTGAGAGAVAVAAEAAAEAAVARRRRAVHVRRSRGRARTELVTLQSLQRRHELRAVLKNYGRFHRLRVVPQLLFLSMAEILIAWFTGNRERAAAVIHAWRWNHTERSTMRATRAVVQATRRLDDASVRRLQLHGSARLTAYVRRTIVFGARAARLGRLEEPEEVLAADGSIERERQRRSGASRSSRVVVWSVVVLVLLFGTRQLLGTGFPYMGQLLPFVSWSAFLHHFMSGWQYYGVGTTSSATPGTGILGISGLLVFGGVGLLQKIVVFGCIPLGAYGMSKVAGGFGSTRARLASSIAYLAVPLPYDALATGRWDALLVYAAAPWIFRSLARASVSDSMSPSGSAAAADTTAAATKVASRDPFSTTASGRGPGPEGAGAASRSPWQRSILGRMLTLGVIEALLTSLAPVGAVVTLVITAALALGLILVGGEGSRRAAGRVAAVGAGATAVTVLLLAPWSVSMLSGPARWQELFGSASSPGSGASWSQLLHLGVGPIGDTPLAWGFVIAAVLPLLIGAGPRLAWAGRAWVLAGVAWTCAWASGRGWMGPFSVPAEVMLVPAAIAISLAVGLGVAAFAKDLPGYRFGWRQAAAGLAALFAAVGGLPFLDATLSGRWDMPSGGYGEAVSWMAHQSSGNFRVLWLGDPAVVPGAAWKLSSGLSYELSENGLPDATSLWPGSHPGPAAAVGSAIELASSARTVRLGQLLAPYAVRYVVVVSTLAPANVGTRTTLNRPPPPDLLAGLNSQIDLRQVISESGFEVYVDDAALPERALRPPSAEAAPALSGWGAVLSGERGSTHVTGHVGAGTVLAAVAPGSAWQLVGPTGRVERPKVAFGYAATFQVSRPSEVTVRFAGSWRHGLAVAGETALWIIVLGALGLRRKWLDRWLGPARGTRAGRRHRRRMKVMFAGRSRTATRVRVRDERGESVSGREPASGGVTRTTPAAEVGH